MFSCCNVFASIWTVEQNVFVEDFHGILGAWSANNFLYFPGLNYLGIASVGVLFSAFSDSSH